VVPTGWLELTTLPHVTQSYVTINKTCNGNIEERSCNYCCSGRAANIILCVFVALVIQDAKRMRRTVLSGMSGPTLFGHLIT